MIQMYLLSLQLIKFVLDVAVVFILLDEDLNDSNLNIWPDIFNNMPKY